MNNRHQIWRGFINFTRGHSSARPMGSLMFRLDCRRVAQNIFLTRGFVSSNSYRMKIIYQIMINHRLPGSKDKTKITRMALLGSHHGFRQLIGSRDFGEERKTEELNSSRREITKQEKDQSSTRGTDFPEKSKVGVLVGFKEMVNTFWLGCKQLLWIDARKALATKRKLRRHDYDLTILTREELSHMRQTQRDIIKSLPVALLFCVPFIGYFAPVIGYLFPKRLLSQQFWDIEQRKKFAFEEHVKRSQYYRPLVQEVGWSSRELKNQALFQMCIKSIDGNHIENGEILKQREIFRNELLTIKKMPRFHLEKLCKTWLLPVKWYVPSKVLREFLSYRIKQIIEDDSAIRRDGMSILSDLCIRQACHARGLDKYSFDIPVMKQWLEDWLNLTKSLSGEDESFIAHCAAIKTMNFSKIVNKSENAIKNIEYEQ